VPSQHYKISPEEPSSSRPANETVWVITERRRGGIVELEGQV
jgi:hypothetical protein